MICSFKYVPDVKSDFSYLVIRIFLTMLSLVNLHQIALVYTCLGNYFYRPDLDDVKKWKQTKFVLQLIFLATLITNVLIMDQDGNRERIMTVVLVCMYPLFNFCQLVLSN